MLNSNQNVVTENITAYMKSIEKYKAISVERETELAMIIHGDDPEASAKAREELICANLKLVVKIGHDFKRYAMTFADIVAEGNIGLMLAADKFEPGHGAKFSCYAAWWIKQSIRKALLDKCRTVRIPGQCAVKINTINKARDKFMREFDREGTDEEIAAITGFAKDSIEKLHNAMTTACSIDDVITEDSDTTFADMLAEEGDSSVSESEYDEAYKHLVSVLDKFTDMEREIIDDLLICDMHHKKSEDTVTQELGITHTWLHIMIQDIYAKFRKYLGVK